MNPDDAYKGVAMLDSVLKIYSSKLMLRQGENGAPSGYCPGFALSKYNWTEVSQAKWDTRRMLGDLGRDIESEVFTIADLYYKTWGDGGTLNLKGLLHADNSLRVLWPKMAFYSVQHVASVFDSKLNRMKDMKYRTSSGEPLSVFGYQHKSSKMQVITIWQNGGIPGNHFDTKNIEIVIENGNFSKPVWVDIYSGRVYEIPKDSWSQSGQKFTFNVPVYDSPVLIADLSLLKIQKI
jgi:hypothetical protein